MNDGERQDQKQNEVNQVDALLKIIDRSDKEYDKLLGIYRILIGAITVIVITGIGIGGYFTYKSHKDMLDEHRAQVKDMRDDLKDQMKDMKQKTDENLTFLQNRSNEKLTTVVKDVGNKVNTRIDEEFKKENIQTLIQQKAQEYTEKNVHNYIGEKVDSTIKPIETSLREQNETLTQQVADWSNRSKIMKLSDEAIEKCDAQSFKELFKYKGTDLEFAASAEISRVKIAYVSASRMINETLTVTELDGSRKSNNEIKTSTLMKILKTDSSWESRMKAAQLLNNRSEEGVPDALLEAAKKDKHLEVVKHSLLSFGIITGYRHDVLESVKYEEWWSQNKSKIAKKLKPLDSK